MADYSDLMKLEKKTKTPTPPAAILTPPPPIDIDKSASLLANQQTSKEENQQASKEANQQTSKEEKKQTNKPVNQQASKLLKKFGSYLREDSIKALKQIALLTDRKDYEVLQDAVDFYLKHKGSR